MELAALARRGDPSYGRNLLHTAFADSEKRLRRIIELVPDDARALNHLGYPLADRTDRHEEALHLIERAIAIAPDDPAIIGGLGRIDGRSVMIIGHEKGRDTKSKVRRNFGMPRPEGYRKALRLMKMAERFGLPLLTFIDTPGAYPGIGAEERGQSEAIARNLMEMAELEIPILCTVIGEGGSGGALAIGVGDRTLMLEYSTYSVISPEGCASILWKDAGKKREAAEQLGLTATRLHGLGLVDKVVREPIGGAHRNPSQTATRLKAVLLNQLDVLEAIPAPELVEQRYQRLRGYGAYDTA